MGVNFKGGREYISSRGHPSFSPMDDIGVCNSLSLAIPTSNVPAQIITIPLAWAVDAKRSEKNLNKAR